MGTRHNRHMWKSISNVLRSVSNESLPVILRLGRKYIMGVTYDVED